MGRMLSRPAPGEASLTAAHCTLQLEAVTALPKSMRYRWVVIEDPGREELRSLAS
jgi:hypothetical protein